MDSNTSKKNVISFVNMKGGVGKTTICVNIAAQLAKTNKKILVIDMDPQMNASQYLLSPDIIESLINNHHTIYNLYEDTFNENFNYLTGNELHEDLMEHIDDNCSIIQQAKENLDVICGDLRMTNVDEKDGTISDILNAFIEENNLQDTYNFIFIDCPPTQSIYTISAFKASNFYLIVIKPDYLSTIGLSLFQKMISSFNSRRGKKEKLNCLGIVINLYQPQTDYHKDKVSELKSIYKFSNFFTTKIANKSAIAKYSEEHKFMYDINGCKRQIINLAKEFTDEYKRRSGNE